MRADGQAQAADGTGVAISLRDRAGLMTLAGARLTLPMCRVMAGGLERFARDPHVYCAILTSAGDGPFCLCDDSSAPDRDALAAAADLVWRIDRFTKPHVALLAGLVTGAGLSLIAFGTHRVAAGAVTFAATDAAGGPLPPGVSLALSRLQGGVGLYMALTGHRIEAALAWRLGLLTHIVAPSQFAAIATRLADADPVDAVLDALDARPVASRLDPHLPAIARCFALGPPDAIVTRLDAERGESAGWAAETAAVLRAAPLLTLAVRARVMAMQAGLSLREALALDVRVASNAAGAGSLEEHFAPLNDGELVLPPEPMPPSIG